MDVLARAGLVDLDDDISGFGNSPNLSSWPISPLFLRKSPLQPSPSVSPPQSEQANISPNLMNRVLPPEILLGIFELLTYDISDHGPNWQYSSSWLSITHVCTSWRNLALSSPLLWSRVSFARSGDLASTMLSRSSDAPLDIAYGDRLARLPPLSLYTALEQLHRISKLHLNVTRALLAHLASRLPSHAPTLKRAHIDLVDGMHAPGAGHALPGIADLNAPELRVLILDGVPLPPTASLLLNSTKLTELVLSGIPRPARWGVSDMLRTLSHMSSLTRLLLVHAVEEDYDDEPRGPHISLPALSQMTVHAPTPAVAALVASITTNTRTRYTLSCAAREDKDTSLSSAIPQSLRTGALKRLDVTFGLTEFAVRAYTLPTSPVVLELLLEPERVLDAKHSSGRASLIELVQSGSTVDLTSIKRLSVMNDGAISRDDMYEAYGALAGRMPVVDDFGCHVRDMSYDSGAIGETFLRCARTVRVRVGSWLPDDDRFGCTGRDWAVACIRKWCLDEREEQAVLEEVVLDDKDSFTGSALRCLLGLDPSTEIGPEDPPWIVEERTPVVVAR